MDPLLFLLRQLPRPDWQWKLDAQTGWSRSNALSLANCALLAYDDKDVIEQNLRTRGFTKIFHLELTNSTIDTQGFLAVCGDAVVIAFRGTEPTNPVDFFTDFTTASVAFEDRFNYSGWGNVWAGWADGVLAVLPQVLEILKEYDDDQHSLWITGHSLGGALAMVTAAVIANLNAHPIQGVYTYGQPRVGDPVFCRRYARELGNQTFRHVNDRDLVPHIPPRRFTRLEQQLFNAGGVRIRDVANAVQHRREAYEYDHVGQLRLLLPGGGWSDDLALETEREPAFFKEERTFPLSLVNLAQLSLEAAGRIKDHAPINPVTHDGYTERLEGLK